MPPLYLALVVSYLSPLAALCTNERTFIVSFLLSSLSTTATVRILPPREFNFPSSRDSSLLSNGGEFGEKHPRNLETLGRKGANYRIDVNRADYITGW